MAKEQEVIIKKTKPKYVKVASSWVVTSTYVGKDGKVKQKQEWFDKDPALDEHK
jgi:hypothetical protein